MASFQKRNDGWRVFIRRKGSEPISKTFPSKADARDWAAQQETAIVDGRLGNIPKQSFGKLLERYRDTVSIKKRGHQWEAARVGLALRDPIAQVALRELNETHVAEWRDRRLKHVQRSSVRREWTLYSHACNLAVKEWKWLRVNPFTKVQRPKPMPARQILYTADQINRLTHALGLDPKTAIGRVGIAFLFAIETGMRAGEIRALKWDHVDILRRFARVMMSKTEHPRDVPLSLEALRLLGLLPANSPTVFQLTAGQLDALFRKGKERALVEGTTFHDTRHLAITRLAEKIDVLSLARMVGHKDLRQLMTYYNKSAEDIAKQL